MSEQNHLFTAVDLARALPSFGLPQHVSKALHIQAEELGIQGIQYKDSDGYHRRYFSPGEAACILNVWQSAQSPKTPEAPDD